MVPSFTPHLGYATIHDGTEPLGEGPIMAFPVYPVADYPGSKGAAEFIIKMGTADVSVWLPAARFWELGVNPVPGLPDLPGNVVAVVFTECEQEEGVTLQPVALHAGGKFVPCYQTEQEALAAISASSA